MTDAQKGIFIGIVLGIILFVSGIGVIENQPDNDLLWAYQYNWETWQTVIEVALETGDINMLVLLISMFVFFSLGLGVGSVIYIHVFENEGYYLRSSEQYWILSSMLTLLILIVVLLLFEFRFAEPASPIQRTMIVMERDIQSQQAHLTATAEQNARNLTATAEQNIRNLQMTQTHEAAQGTLSALGITQTALAAQAQGTLIPPSPLPTSTVFATFTLSPTFTPQPETIVDDSATPDTLATQQAELDTLNVTATAQVTPVSDVPDNDNGNIFAFIINLLRDNVFQGLGFFVGLLSLFVAIFAIIYQINNQRS